jgi:Zn-dependent protease
MGELIDLIDKTKKYYKFSPKEIRSIIITVIVLAFIVSFGEWGPGEEVNLFFGFINLINAILIVTLSFLIHLSAKKIAALHVGYRAEYDLWSFGLLFSLMIIFISTAWGKPVWIFLAGGVMLQHLAGHRIGHFRYDINYYEAGWISMAGPFSNILLAAILKAMAFFNSTSLIQKAITFNLLFALYNSLPIPPLDGSRMFFGSRMVYALSFFFILAAVILLWIDIPVWIALIGSALIAVIGWLLYYIFIEKGMWRGPF